MFDRDVEIEGLFVEDLLPGRLFRQLLQILADCEVGLGPARGTKGVLAHEAQVAFVAGAVFLEEVVADGGLQLAEAFEEV